MKKEPLQSSGGKVLCGSPKSLKAPGTVNWHASDESLLWKNSATTLALIVAVLASMVFIPHVYSTRPVVSSQWTNKPPIIDGKFSPGEWSNPQIVFQTPPYPGNYLDAFIYFANNNSTLYAMVDAVGDQTDHKWDEALLVFVFPGKVWVEFWGADGRKCDATGNWCTIPAGVTTAIGYGTSPNSPFKHKIYEAQIPLALMNATAGQSVDFCSPQKPTGGSISYDYDTGRDNVWPDGLVQKDVQTWGILGLASTTVPEFPTAWLIMTVGLLAATILVTSNRRLHEKAI
jgi:hypothetical protein